MGCSQAHDYAKLVYYAAFVVIFQFGWASTQISHLAAIPDLATSQHERTGLTAIRNAMTVSANILVYLSAWIFLGGSRDSDMICPSDASAFGNLMVVCMVIGTLTTIGYQVFVRFPNTATGSNEDQSNNLFNATSVMSFLSWFKETQLYQIALIYMSTRLFVNLSQAYIPLYLQVTLQLHATHVATVPLTIFLSGFFTSLSMKKINKRLGRKITFIIGSLVGFTACLWIRLGSNPDANYVVYFVYCEAVLIGIAGSTMLICSLSLTAEFIADDTSSSAFIYGLMSLTDKVSNGIAVVLIQHFIPSKIDTCIVCQQYFRDIILWACGGAAILGMLTAISLCYVTVGARRSRPTLVTLNINQESSEETPLLAD